MRAQWRHPVARFRHAKLHVIAALAVRLPPSLSPLPSVIAAEDTQQADRLANEEAMRQKIRSLAGHLGRNDEDRLGLRTLSDMEYEFGMTLTNHRLDPEIETVFLMADGEYSHVSSTLIKQVAYYGGTEALKRFVPEELIPSILAKLS